MILAILFARDVYAIVNRINGKNKKVSFKRIEFSDLEGWEDDRHDVAVKAFIRSCDRFALLPHERKIGVSIEGIDIKDMRNVCEIAYTVDGMSQKYAKNFFENWFVPFEVRDGNRKKTGLFTGYYEIQLYGKRVKDDTYKYPIYAKPKGLGSKPYYTRKEIDDGILEDRGLEIFYVDDKIDLFFLHIQGSGRIILENGSVIKVGFAGRNNHSYTSIGKVMIERNLVDRRDVSAGKIKEWLRNNPEFADEILQKNNSYIFFRELKDNYIRGAQGAVLTPERSLAVDSGLIPYGFPMWVETTIPVQDDNNESYNRLMVAQDTGSAIKGAIRGDIFFGAGERAEELASYTKQKGKYYILLPKNVVDKVHYKSRW